MKYKSVVLTKRGGPEGMQVMEFDLRAPQAGEVRIRVLASTVGRADLFLRREWDPVAPPLPFTPGWEMVGVVDAVGEQVTRVAVGDRIGALIMHGGYSEYAYLKEDVLVHVPAGLDTAEAVRVILDFTTAYQILHRNGKVKEGDKVLIIGAGGNVGQALLQIGKLAGIKMYGVDSPSKNDMMKEYGATPIDYKSQDYVQVIHEMEPNGLDLVIDAIGDAKLIQRAFSVVRPGGRLIVFGSKNVVHAFLGVFLVAFLKWLPNGKESEFYSVPMLQRTEEGRKSIQEDIAAVFKLLGEGKLKSIVTTKLPILEARQANELFESGKIKNKIVLLASELL
jgi:NADPH:quinone reductase-like Zn-dependent oxidoreductase